MVKGCFRSKLTKAAPRFGTGTDNGAALAKGGGEDPCRVLCFVARQARSLMR